MSKKLILPPIEKGHPMPAPKGPRKRAPFISPWLAHLSSMEVGDSVRVPTFRVACLHSNAKRLGMTIVAQHEGRMTDPNDWRLRMNAPPAEYHASRVWVLSKPTVENDFKA